MKQKRFMGIVPPQTNILGQRGRPQPPNGLAYVLGELKKKGWDVLLLDALAEGYNNMSTDEEQEISITGLSLDEIVSSINGYRPSIIGIHLGCSTDQNVVYDLSKKIKSEYGEETPIILGGAAASLMKKEILGSTKHSIEKIPYADFVVSGRDIGVGESPTLNLSELLLRGGSLEDTAGISFRKNGRVVTIPPIKPDLRKLNYPDRELFARRGGIDIYSHINNPHAGRVDDIPFAVLNASFGCGANCSFCHITYAGGVPLEHRPLNHVKSELKHLKEKGVNTIHVEDDNFGGFTAKDLDWSLEIITEIGKLGFKGLYFPNALTFASMYDKGNYRLLRKMRELTNNGLKTRVSLPIESGDDYTLVKLIRKPHNLRMVGKVLDEIEKGGYLTDPNIYTEAFLMVGVVGYHISKKGGYAFLKESEKSIENTFSLADEIAEKGVHINLWYCKPNPNGPQYQLWRNTYPEAPFHNLLFTKPPGIWGDRYKEHILDKKVRQKNEEYDSMGKGSLRTIYPKGDHKK